MRREHLVILFAILFMTLFMGVIVSRASFKNASSEKYKVDYALQMSVDVAAEQLAKSYGNENLSDYLNLAVDEFFKALSAGLNIYTDSDKQEELLYYVPAILVTSTDGFYINYLSKATLNGVTVLQREWTECQPYYYSDAYFVYRFFLNDEIIIYEKQTGEIIKSTSTDIFADTLMLADLSLGNVFQSEAAYYEYKQAAVARSIAECLERAVNTHNIIAGQFGVSTLYGIPDFLTSYTPAQEYPSLVAIFQGYPLTADHRIIYNGASTSAAYISVVPRYVVEVSIGPAHPFSLLHKETCTMHGTFGKVLEGRYTVEEAMQEYGVYACPHCFIEGEGVPILP